MLPLYGEICAYFTPGNGEFDNKSAIFLSVQRSFLGGLNGPILNQGKESGAHLGVKMASAQLVDMLDHPLHRPGGAVGAVG
jgi:hypothetical protein